MPHNPVMTIVDDAGFPVDGTATTTIAAGTAAATVVKASPGRLVRVVVTATGSAATTFFDNASAASGTALGVVPASAAVGTVFEFRMAAANGITTSGSASAGGFTIRYA